MTGRETALNTEKQFLQKKKKQRNVTLSKINECSRITELNPEIHG
jgi:hypothetical protein